MNANLLIVLYILFSLLGWIWETVFLKTGRNHCGDTLTQKLGYCLPLLNIYGIGAVILIGLPYSLNIEIEKPDFITVLLLSIIATILITGMECIIGLISFKINGHQTWNYKSTICKGYISGPVSLFWFLCSFSFYSVFTFAYKNIHLFEKI